MTQKYKRLHKKNYQMCTNTKIHAALLKTKAQNITKLKYLVPKNQKTNKKKKKKKKKII
jgi:hypothetical protein